MNLWNALKHLFISPSDRDKAQSLQKFQQLIGYQFHDESLLKMSLTHRSYSHSHDNNELCNERLEFLGDSVLGLVIAEQLYRDQPKMQEGQLTKTKALLVNESTLADIGRDLTLNDYIRLASEEERSGGRDRPSIIADAFESVIAAVFLDSGLDAAHDLILRLIYAHREEIISDASRRNFKGELLEHAQALADGLPRYDVVLEEGPDHEKIFHVEVYIGNTRLGTGSGLSKKDAEQKAAAMALERYKKHHE